MSKEVVFDAEKISKAISKSLSKDVQESIRKEAKVRVKEPQAQAPPQPQQAESKRSHDYYEKSKYSADQGSQEATKLQSDLQDAKSGQWYGFVSRKMESLKKGKDAFKRWNEENKDDDKKSIPGIGGSTSTGGSSGSGGGLPDSIRSLRIAFLRIGKLDIAGQKKHPEIKTFNPRVSLSDSKIIQPFKNQKPEQKTPILSLNKQDNQGGQFNREVREFKSRNSQFQRVVIRDAFFRNVKGNIGGGGGSRGALPMPMGGGGGAGSGLTGGMGSGMGRVGSALGLAGGFAVAGGAMMLQGLSSISGMYQQAMQSQDSTLDALGYVGSGGALTSNAEMARIQLARMKYGSGTNEDRNYSQDAYQTMGFGRARESADGMSSERRWERVTRYRDNNLDIKFGLSQGIGATQGAEIFGKMGKFGEQGKINPQQFSKLIESGVAAGFAGKRQSEFFQGIANVLEESAKSGFGKGNAVETGLAIANLKDKGLTSDRALSVFSSLNKGIQSDGNTLNAIALAGNLNSGKGILESMAGAEGGANAENLAYINQMFEGYDPETKGLIYKQLGIGSATENYKASQKGTSITEGLDRQITDPTVRQQANRDVSALDRVGQSYRAIQNQVDNLVASMGQVYKLQLQITKDILKMFEGMTDPANDTSSKLQEYYKKMKQAMGML